jgi:hypothetical protein
MCMGTRRVASSLLRHLDLRVGKGHPSEAKPDVVKQLLKPGMPRKIPVNHQGVAGCERKVEGKSGQVKNTGMRDSTIAVSAG